MKTNAKILTLLLSLFIAGAFNRMMATHIVGGEIYYECVDTINFKYRLTVKIYRDCFNGVAPMPASIPISVFKVNTNGSYSLFWNIEYVKRKSYTPVPGSINDACFNPPSTFCLEMAVYDTLVTLPQVTGGYTLAYQSCCRNTVTNNISNPGGSNGQGTVGMTWTTVIPSKTTAKYNNSATFNQAPPLYLCTGVPISIDHSANDKDGDSLVYSLCDPWSQKYKPFTGFDPTSGSDPLESSKPPYTGVTFINGYSAAKPFDASPALAIDPYTGKITGTPTSVGIWAVGICVTEYRKGVKVGQSLRDYQFVTTACNPVQADITPQSTICNGLTVNFNNASKNATKFFWDFGNGDTSNTKNPSYTFDKPGDYTVMLVVKNDQSLCSDTVLETFRVYNNVDAQFAQQTICGGTSVQFNNLSDTSLNATHLWDFGVPSSLTDTSTSFFPTFNFPDTGKYTVTLYVNPGSVCADTASVLAHIFNGAMAGTAQDTSCNGLTFNFKNNSIADYYLWDFGDGTTSADSTPTHTYQDTGIYNVTLYANPGNICTDTVTVPFYIYPPSIAAFSQQTFCGGYTINFKNNSGVASFYHWDFGDGKTSADSTPTHTYADSGVYNVRLITSPGNICADTAYSQFRIYKQAFADFAYKTNCDNKTVEFINKSTNDYGFDWDFGDMNGSSDSNPTHIYAADSGHFQVKLIVSPGNMCSDTIEMEIVTYPVLVVSFAKPQNQCYLGHNFNFTLEGNFTAKANILWDFGSFANPTYSDKIKVDDLKYLQPGTYPVVVKVTDYKNCTKFHYDTLRVYPMPVADFSHTEPECVPFDISFINKTASADNIASWYWNLGDSTTSTIKDPSHTYKDLMFAPGTNYSLYKVTLITITENGCSDTIQKFIQEKDCEILIPNVITNDGDGKNDKLHIKNLEHFPGSKIVIYDRWGLMLYTNEDYKNDWDGTLKSGKQVPMGTYYMVLYLSDGTVHPGYFTIFN